MDAREPDSERALEGPEGDAVAETVATGVEAPDGAPVAEGPVAPPRTIIPRWVQAVLLPLGLVGLYLLAVASGPVVLILTIASIVALILNPLVRRFSRVLPRGLAILASYLVVIVLFAAVGLLLADPIASQLDHFKGNVPELTRKANSELNSIQAWLNHHGVKVHIEKQGETALQTVQKTVLKQSGSILSFSKNLISKLVILSVDGVLILVLSVYLLIYARSIGELVRRIMPPGDGTPEDDFPRLVQRAVGHYVRGQVSFSVVMGTSAAVSLWIFGELNIFPDGSRYAVFFGAFYGLMEFIPYVGPIVGPIPALAVALFTNPISALWVLLLVIALQQLEGHVVAPQMFRISLRINPILVIVALLVGEEIWGIPGALVALPVATVLRQTVIYLRDHLVLEPWTQIAAAIPTPVPATPAPVAAVSTTSGSGPQRPPAGPE